ncbi:unnamed protein product [Bursaphelenchus xylophilus]|uniref:(pine wood nematode) hypothetical protein n=1 Tax=Bursaphelenchus xylophilus TaxID=6326 RepID=A0A1I7SQE1_BURXY|nr:unnamed protein product [Bursaphelenchus xylophilus]CAG9109773.1 unnamed protein product [Bursaphelenchus xylophilus]
MPQANAAGITGAMQEHLVFELGNCFFGAVLPLYVIFLVITRTKDQGVKVYRKMLITNAAIDLFYTLSTLMSFPTIVFSSTRLIPVMTNPLMPREASWFFFMIQTFFIYLSVMILPIQFIYRYRVASSKAHTISTIVVPLAFAAVYNAAHTLLLLYTFQSPNEEYDRILSDMGVESGGKYVVGDVVSIAASI